MTPVSQTILEASNDFIIYDQALVSTPSARLFDPKEWGERATPHSEGRGTVWFIRHADGEWVLKAFQRGGLVGRFIKRHYFFSGNRRTRMAREYHFLSRLHQMGLPVPRPVAAYSKRTALFGYSGSLITQRLSNVRSLASWLSGTESLDDRRWREIGRTIREFHDCDVFHSDLNAGNVLLSEDSVYLIDFDRGRFRSSGFGVDWRQANLTRLKRSLDKLSVGAQFNLERAWELFYCGYEGLSTG